MPSCYRGHERNKGRHAGNPHMTRPHCSCLTTFVRFLLYCNSRYSMRQEYKPAQTSNNKGDSGKNYQLLQYFHDLLLNWLALFPGKYEPQSKLSYKSSTITIESGSAIPRQNHSIDFEVFPKLFSTEKCLCHCDAFKSQCRGANLPICQRHVKLRLCDYNA